ncbi:50S ribosomal protein L13 [Aspergillus heteromorphus CBS 117.55]|uniref:Large ribosomal subunit protein uL13m n=1 Tax=Aspergillus heteromorphus CBS 117.55 TaxID=1448321 RepID=A0A317VKH3_9EURO|nr:50S ribosomal protein L13 [Aspergillus heteromorphus CBS 117.55]PWY73667.1 50S ribosomal protein L13 [Aspergillus heteromorphus CBS 117.55]
MSQTVGKTRLAFSRTWHRVDVSADQRTLGRLASSIALVLMGKNKPIYDPSTDCGDYVVALGCHDLRTTGNKRAQKKYYTHNTRPGSLKSMTMDQMFEKWGGGEVLRRAVRGMLPKNRLRDKRLARLKTFEGLAHPYKLNLVKFNGETVIGGMPQVQQAFETAKSEAAAPAKPEASA